MSHETPTQSHAHADARCQRVLRLIETLDVLPTTVHVPVRLLDLRRKGSAGATDFADILSADPALSARVLALANSASYAPVRPIIRLGDAVSIVGLNNLFSFVFGVSLAGIFNNMGLPARELNGLRKASLLKSVAAREFARRFAPTLIEEAWLGGLLQDVAVPIMYAADQGMWNTLVGLLDSTDAGRTEQEVSLFGRDHLWLGRAVAQKIGLPDLYQQIIAHHHQSVPLERALGASSIGLTRALQFASVLPHRPGTTDPDRFAPRLRHWIPVSRDRAKEEATLSELVSAIAVGYKAILQLVGDSDEDTGGAGFKQFLADLSSEVVRSFESTIGTCASEISRLDREVRQSAA